MNQQRSRRFRSAQEAKEKEADKQELLKLLRKQNGNDTSLATSPESKSTFDSNSITPGTPFMDILAASLRYWCAYKLNTDPAWAKLKVIISDATVPGEGEHKIMDFIRSQRTSPDHDPNTRHVIYGLDADLIMLGLATHEPHFRVLREDVFFQEGKARMCKICGQKGHDAMSCKGQSKVDEESHNGNKPPVLKPFIWLHVSVLREYLAVELNLPGLPFRFDLERAIDDWVFMCSFVGNDFLPHLPALEIRENGIDTLTAIWKDNLPAMGGYVTKDGVVDLERAQFILNGLSKQEDAIFRRRKEAEDRREANAKRRKLQDGRNGQNSSFKSAPGYRQPLETPTGDLAATVNLPRVIPPAITHDMVMNRNGLQHANDANKSAASVLRGQIRTLNSQGTKVSDGSQQVKATLTGGIDITHETAMAVNSSLGKRKASEVDKDGNAEENAKESHRALSSTDTPPQDSVRLWEDGYADRYYQQKFHVNPDDVEFRHKVARAYVEGLAWVLLYYFQGCPSWEWFYPYHYAPFAADFVDIAKMDIKFNKGRIVAPFEQLMSVLPAASRHALPEVFHDLMTREDSEIIDFYPEGFDIDLNGKKMAWQGVALLPFIDMSRLLEAVQKKYPLLSATDVARNSRGKDVLLVSDAHLDLYDDITASFYSKKQAGAVHQLDCRVSNGLAGKVEKIEDYLPHGCLPYPLTRKGLPDIDFDRSLRYLLTIISTHPPQIILLS
jgi:5'-3' exoribonuclease 2